MIHEPTAENQTILFGVTSSQSLKLLGKIPNAMADAGWDVHVVAGDTASEVPKDLDGVEVHIVPMKRNPSPINDLHSLARWTVLLSRVKPTIVVIGTPKASLLGMLAASFCRVPVRVYQLRGLRLQTVSGLARHVLSLMEWIIAKSSTNILAVSNSLENEYCRLGLGETKKVEVLGLGSSHGVDVNYFHPTRWSGWEPPEPKLKRARSGEMPILGFVGRFSRDKGAQELLQCCQVLLEAGITHTILIIGPLEGDEEALSELRRLNRDTVITGALKDVAPYYSVMDLLILPTHREGFPNAVLEAAASGVPTVTTTATGAIDSVIDGHTGMIVPTHDGRALGAAVMGLVTDSQLLEEMGLNARNWVVSNFDSNSVTQKHSLYLTQKVRTKILPDGFRRLATRDSRPE